MKIEIISCKSYHKPLKIEYLDLENEFVKKRKNPGNHPFMNTFGSWVQYWREKSGDESIFEGELLEIEKAETLAIMENKIQWAEEAPGEAGTCLMTEIKELFAKARDLGCDVSDAINCRWLKLCEVEAIDGLEAKFCDAENYSVLSGPISSLLEAIENARAWGYDVSDYENRRLPEIKRKRALSSVAIDFQCLESFASTMKPITNYADWKEEIIGLEQLMVEAEDLGCDTSRYRKALPELKKNISMNEVEKALWKQQFYPEKSSCLPQNIALLIDEAEREGNDVTDARRSLKEIMR